MDFSFNADEIFQIAIEIEDNGRIFYEKAREFVDDKDVKELFSYLALQESEHKKTFLAMKSDLPDSSRETTLWDPDNETDQYLKMMADMNVFNNKESLEGRLAEISDLPQALRLAIQFEKDSILFYLFMQDFTTDASGKDRINALIGEEKAHLRELARRLRKHSDCG